MKKLVSFAIICAVVLCYAGILLTINGNGQEITNVTGIIVLILSTLCFLKGGASINKGNCFSNFMFCIGWMLIFIEYFVSVFMHINLNVYTSIFWCDCGLMCIGIAIIGQIQFVKILVRKLWQTVKQLLFASS